MTKHKHGEECPVKLMMDKDKMTAQELELEAKRVDEFQELVDDFLHKVAESDSSNSKDVRDACRIIGTVTKHLDVHGMSTAMQAAIIPFDEIADKHKEKAARNMGNLQDFLKEMLGVNGPEGKNITVIPVHGKGGDA
jgi:hypothetical protein